MRVPSLQMSTALCDTPSGSAGPCAPAADGRTSSTESKSSRTGRKILMTVSLYWIRRVATALDATRRYGS